MICKHNPCPGECVKQLCSGKFKILAVILVEIAELKSIYRVSQKKCLIANKSVTQKTHFSSKSPQQLFLKIASNFKSKLVPYEDKKKTVISSFGKSSSSFRPGVEHFANHPFF